MTELSAIAELRAINTAISELVNEVDRARKLPNVRANECAGIKFYNGESNSWGSKYGAPDDVYERFKDAANAFAASEKERAERERDARLASLALQAEALRAVLPQIAAQAAVELGAFARAWKQEAGQ